MSVVGVVLAGGQGRRMGGDKALAEHAGLALLHHPLRALAAVSRSQAVVAKEQTRLPALPPGVRVWREPALPQHPSAGILHALRAAGGEAVLCCAVDLPLLDAATLQRLLDADDGRQACVVPRVGGCLEPLCALWRPGAAAALAAAGGHTAMRTLVIGLAAREVDYTDDRAFTNVNTPEELAAIRP